MFTPAQAAGFFFQPCRDEHDEVILEEHPDYESLMLAATTAETGSILNYVRRSSLNLFSWLEWILKNNLPLSLCENDADGRYPNLDSICVETLVAGMVILMRAVERIIAGEMPERFGLILDKWSHASEHYIAVYARYEVHGVVKTPLLCMAPVLNEEEESLSACGHMEFLATMLPQDYGKQLDQCCFPVADNCAVNRRLATLMGVPLVGCASHRLNRAVQVEMEAYEDDLDAAQKLMIRMRTLKQSAKHRTKRQVGRLSARTLDGCRPSPWSTGASSY
ncbi:hypothetical protein PC129_g16082 [Phytophthora cactorum]|uniref:Uncharacterized protein n=2 Tax=Phytophthora cactorum TaxID=29920 RepID=A0A329RQV5_9STRA|nr:hypothetical protein PC114_g17967 [Phytophthora cactorum]KAG2993053.1 hypothetical protein PC119_g18542 [Phytophthora cactorum]KAG3005407.1 hypothetical protein PC120_g17981 [Phytophthora cactorum]KAG3067593.1 hypothetical protein PC122_g17298 [Phytophthora cactorum]KAG3212979.1 hypothetical protein PC129_g16082 [Phytophthora cactorum]